MTISFPGARAPDREYTIDSWGVGISVHEWGDEAAPPLLLVHGGFDFARTFDAFAPLIADAGWRCIGWDHRGHGDSEHAPLYSFEADVRDAIAVFDSVTKEPMPVIAHSKGGSMMLQLAEIAPHRFSKMVNIDGMPSPRRHLDVQGHERTMMMESAVHDWLGWRRKIHDAVRKPGTIEELAQRRARMIPRLSLDWLQYLVTVGAREDADGWRWKIDPSLRFGGFGPWRHSWAIAALPALSVPMLGLLGLMPEEMGWGTHPSQLEPYLPPDARVIAFEDAGHFVHIEKPREVADLVLEFLN